jgi:hypothetical protein
MPVAPHPAVKRTDMALARSTNPFSASSPLSAIDDPLERDVGQHPPEGWSIWVAGDGGTEWLTGIRHFSVQLNLLRSDLTDHQVYDFQSTTRCGPAPQFQHVRSR